MKQRLLFLLASLLLMMVGMQNAWAQDPIMNYNMTVWKNGKMTEYVVTDVDSVTFRPLYGKLVTSLTIDKTEVKLGVNEGYWLYVTILPEDASNKEVIWESSNPEVATPGTGLYAYVRGKNPGTCVITCRATDGSGAFAECLVTVTNENMYVDLGLPSGTLWAKWNVGATSPGEPGDYFAWGETEPKEDYSWETYKWCKGSYITLTKYNQYPEYGYKPDGSESGYTDDLTELLPEDDAATVNWGEDWQMPSVQQLNELLNSDYTTLVEDTKGIVIKSNVNANFIYLPNTSIYIGTELEEGNISRFWTRSLLDASSAVAFKGNDSAINSRAYGNPVRPVRKQ